jgi:hypothetical protein
MGDAVGNDLDSEPLSVADRFIPALPITHYAGELKSLRDPAAVILAIKINRQIHPFIIREMRRSAAAVISERELLTASLGE